MSVVKDALTRIEVALESDMEVYIGKIEKLESLLSQYTQYYLSMLEMTDRCEHGVDELLAAKRRFQLIAEQIPKLESKLADYEARAAQIDEYVESKGI